MGHIALILLPSVRPVNVDPVMIFGKEDTLKLVDACGKVVDSVSAGPRKYEKSRRKQIWGIREIAKQHHLHIDWCGEEDFAQDAHPDLWRLTRCGKEYGYLRYCEA